MKGIETFKQRLIEKGVYKNAIWSNDWLLSCSGYWIVTIPYGYGKHAKHRQRTYKRFSERDANSAVNFWFKYVEKDVICNY